MNREELQTLAHKIDYEGFADYFTGYGGAYPEELQSEVDAFRIAYYELQEKLEYIFDENDVEY